MGTLILTVCFGFCSPSAPVAMDFHQVQDMYWWQEYGEYPVDSASPDSPETTTKLTAADSRTASTKNSI